MSTIDANAMQDISSRQGAVSTREGLNLSLQFIEPLIHSTVSIVDALEDEQEAANQRAVLVAALLHLFAKVYGVSGLDDLRSRLVADVLRCGVELHVILATLRFREELVECRRALLPSYESDSETESELDLDDDEEMGDDTDEFTREDTQWITEQVAKVWGLARFKYFLQTSGQEYVFSAWSYRGIGDFVHALLIDEQHGPNALSVVVSPFSWLFHVAAYSHYMIHSEDHQVRWVSTKYLDRLERSVMLICSLCICCRNAGVDLNSCEWQLGFVLRESWPSRPFRKAILRRINRSRFGSKLQVCSLS